MATPAHASVSVDTGGIIDLAQQLLTDALQSATDQSSGDPVGQSSDAGEIVCDTYSILHQAGVLDVPGSCTGGGSGGGGTDGGGSGGGDTGGGNGSGENGGGGGSSGGDSSGGGSSGGTSGGGTSDSSGGGATLETLMISNEAYEVVEGGVSVTWETNIAATGWVVYGTTSVPMIGGTADGFTSPHYTYGYHTEIGSEDRWWHNVVLDLASDQVWYVRPVATVNGMFAFGAEHEIAIHATTTPEQSKPNQCVPYLQMFIKRGGANDPAEVRKLQDFLRTLEGFTLETSGEYDAPSIAAVEVFQKRYASEVLNPWGTTAPTGHVYLTTRKKINELYCENREQFPLSDAQVKEIEHARLGDRTILGVERSTIAPIVAAVAEAADEIPAESAEGSDSQLAAAAVTADDATPVKNRVFIKNIREHIGSLFAKMRSVLPGFGE